MQKWKNEPDRKEWKSETGFQCLIVRNDHGKFLCGYVGVSPDHPWHGKHYTDIDTSIDVHGGLTYSAECRGKICHKPEPGEEEHLWWLGFDCAHAWDLSPGNLELAERLQDPSFLSTPDQIYRDIDYVTSECESLARQAAEALATA